MKSPFVNESIDVSSWYCLYIKFLRYLRLKPHDEWLMIRVPHWSRGPTYVCAWCSSQEGKAALFCATILFSYMESNTWNAWTSAWIRPWCLNKVSHPFFIWFANISSAVPLKHWYKQRSKNINTRIEENKQGQRQKLGKIQAAFVYVFWFIHRT